MKEYFDKEVIDSALKKIAENEEVQLNVHFIYTGGYYSNCMGLKRLKSLILDVMEHYKMRSLMLTSIRMKRWYIITKEKTEEYFLGRQYENQSVNDDLDSFFDKNRASEITDEMVETYFLPKLTKEEIQLVSKRDSKYMKSFFGHKSYSHEKKPANFMASIDVNEVEMNLSESKSKFVKGRCKRNTIIIKK